MVMDIVCGAFAKPAPSGVSVRVFIHPPSLMASSHVPGSAFGVGSTETVKYLRSMFSRGSRPGRKRYDF